MKHSNILRLLILLLFIGGYYKGFAEGHVGDKTVNKGFTVTLSVPSTYTDIQKRYGCKNSYWYSEHSSVASISSSDMYSASIKGIGVGTTRIHYYASFFVDNHYRTHELYWEIKVIDNTSDDTSDPIVVYVSRITLDIHSMSLKVGEKRTLKAKVDPSYANNRRVSWSSSNKNVATVSSTGEVNANSEGTATIICQANDGSGKMDCCEVTVERLKDGDIFTGSTIEGKELSFKVISAIDKTCEVAEENGNGLSGSVTIPYEINGLKVIGIEGCAFMDNSITNISIPNSVTYIGSNAFDFCSNLKSVTIGNGVTSIGDEAFFNCSSLTSLTIGNSVKSIGDNVFHKCYGLISITIPSSVISIGEGTFSSCSGLTSIKVESGNLYYDSRNNCNAIIEKSSNALIAGCKNTIIPSSVTIIGSEAFYGCSGLTSITIPSSVTNIGSYAFSYCGNLTSVTVGLRVPLAIESSTFSNRANATLIVPKGSKAAYESADYWKEFKYIVEEANLEEITIGDAGKTTYVCDADLDFRGSGLTAYIVIGIEGTTLWMTPLDEVPAGTAVYVKGAKGTYHVNKTTLKKIYYKNLLIGNNSNEKLSVTPDGTNQYFYVGTKGFVRFTAERSIGAHKAYVCVAPLPASKAGSSVALTISDAQRTSLCADVDLDFSNQSDLKAYTVIGYDGQIWMTQVDHVSAGTPLYVKGPKGEYTIPSSAVQAVYTNMLVGNNTNAAITIHPTDGEYSNYFIGKSGFSKVTSDRTVSAHKSYLQILTSYLPAGTRGVAEGVLDEIECEATAVSIVDEDSETTGIQTIREISSDDKWYDLNGHRINTPTKKGLYIKNGKKIVVK